MTDEDKDREIAELRARLDRIEGAEPQPTGPATSARPKSGCAPVAIASAVAIALWLLLIVTNNKPSVPPGGASPSSATPGSAAENGAPGNSSPSSGSAMPKDQTPDSADFSGRLTLVLGHMTVEKQLRDPGSAEYQAEHIRNVRGLHVLCGEVNARNGFNGRSGFQRFVFVAEAKTAVTSEQVSAAKFRRQWTRWCVG